MDASTDTSSLWHTVWCPAKMMLCRNRLTTNCRGSNTAVSKDSPWATATKNNFSSYCRRKSKQALRDYKKVQIQLENLETSVRDRCKKEFTGQSLSSWVFAASGKLGEPPSTQPLFPFLCTCLCSSEQAIIYAVPVHRNVEPNSSFLNSLIQGTVILTDLSHSPLRPPDSGEEVKSRQHTWRDLKDNY